MKGRLLAFLGAGLLALVAILVSNKKPKDSEQKALSVVMTDADRIENDGAAVFQKAFWRRPSDKDKILQAERREWLAGGNVQRWEWYLEVEPSDELLEFLREKNSFGLRKTSEPVASPSPVPSWFRFKGARANIWTATNGEMTLYYLPEKIFAMGNGGGFQSGAETPTREDRDSEEKSKGRLPPHSPPAE